MPIKGWDVIFFYFLDEKSSARVAKVPAAILNPTFVYGFIYIFSPKNETEGISLNLPTFFTQKIGDKCVDNT